MVKTGQVMALYANELINEEGVLEPNEEAPDLTPFSKLYQMVHKKPPSGPYWDALEVTICSRHAARRHDDAGDAGAGVSHLTAGLRRNAQRCRAHRGFLRK